MLSLQIKSGEYITIGENVVIQVFQRSGSQFRLAIQAPRELPIMRGEVRERDGSPRPESIDRKHANVPSMCGVLPPNGRQLRHARTQCSSFGQFWMS